MAVKLDLSDPPSTYSIRLIRNTRYGAVVGAFFQFIYSLIYFLDGFPAAAAINLVGFFACVIAYIILTRFQKHHLAAHIITAGLFFSVTATSLLTGGVSSSSLPWLCFVPIAAMYMSSIKSGFVWFIFCTLAVAVVYLSPNPPTWINAIRPSSSADRLIDVLGLLAVLTAAVSISERLTRNTLNELNNVQKQLQVAAAIDPLTQAFNRRYFFEQAGVVFQSNHGSHSTIVLFDIDHFKSVNDTYGHLIGDQILTSIVKICKQHLRQQDIFARFGGEEFIILMPATHLSEALPVIFELRRKVACEPIQTESQGIPITISIGISSTELLPLSLDDLISQADRAMYLAKDNGRNRVVAWQQAEITENVCGD